MSESGGRRIKRSIYVDMNSIKFCNTSMIEKYKSINLISDYITKKQTDLNAHNQSVEGSNETIINRRALNFKFINPSTRKTNK